MKQFMGVYPPVVTVFTNGGEIDSIKTSRFMHYLIEQGIHGLFVGGSTGEASLMTPEQRKQIIQIGIEVARGRLPVLAGTGCNGTKMTIELSRYAQDTGADGVVVSMPHYPKPDQQAIYEHYRAIKQEIGIPLFIYNYPDQYGVDIDPETVARLAWEGLIQGIKDTHVDLDHTLEIIRLAGDRMTVWQGFDSKLFSALCLGASGGIFTLANIIPREMVSIYQSFQEARWEDARQQQFKIMGLVGALSRRHDMQLLKEGLKMLGHDVGDALMPTSRVPDELIEALRDELTKLGLI